MKEQRGRPRKSASLKRSERMTFAVTKDEADQLYTAARQARLPVSVFLRKLLEKSFRFTSNTKTSNLCNSKEQFPCQHSSQ